MLGPLHSQSMCHIPHGTFSSSVGSRGRRAVGPIGCHGSSEDNGSLDSKINEPARNSSSAEVGAKYVEIEQLVQLGAAEVQRRLMLCHAGVCDEAVHRPSC